MRRILAGLAIISLVALFIFSALAADENANAVKEFKIKKIKLKGFTGQFIEPLGMLVPDDNVSLVIADDYDEANDLNWVRTFKLTSKDRARKSKVIFDAEGGRVRDCAGFWFSGGGAPFIGSALVILAVRPAGTSDVVCIVAVNVSGSGKRIGDARVIAEFTPPADSYFDEVRLAAGRRELTIGVIVGLGIYERGDTFDGQRACEAYFFELNADGTAQTPTPVEVDLPGDGDYRHVRPYRLMWDGSKWMLPVVMTSFEFTPYDEGKDYSDITGYQLYVLTAKPNGTGNSFEFNTKVIAKAKSIQYWSSFPTPFLLPASGGAAIGAAAPVETKRLIYTLAKPKGSKTVKHHAKKFQYYLQELDDDGGRAGKKKKVRAIKWVRQFTNETGLIWENTQSYFSNAVVGSDGMIYIVHARGASLYRKSDKKNLYELQLDYYSFVPETAEGELVATSNYVGSWLNGPPVLAVNGSVVQVLNQLRDEKQGKQEYNMYISRF